MGKVITRYRMRAGTWAFALHRLSGLGLVAYLPLHIWVTGNVSRHPEKFDEYMRAFDNPLFHFLEWGLLGVVLYHTLNGLRLILIDLDFMADLASQKRLFLGLTAAGAALWLVALPFMMRWA